MTPTTCASSTTSRILDSSAAQLVNEYGWMWLWRDGRPSKLMEGTFRFYLGENPTSEERRAMQAYWLALETEWLRVERSLAGVLCFCYLTNNYGYTGDWFDGAIKDLKPVVAIDWFAHCFAPAAVFIDLVDERYTKHIPPSYKRYVPVAIDLPREDGGYLLLAAFTPDVRGTTSPVLSRRYIRVGEAGANVKYGFYDLAPPPVR